MAFLCFLSLEAQENVIYVDNIKTLQVKPGGTWGEAPILLMGGGNFIEITFDDLQHDFVRYYYRITHCNADWSQSDLYEGDYMTGMNCGEYIGEYTQSVAPEVLYNHYRLTLPNEHSSLLVSGNYRVDILEEGDEEPVACACFSIVEGKVSIDADVTANTDIDSYNSHQQLEFSINYQNFAVGNPESEFKPVVMQNHRWDSHVMGLMPTYMRNNSLIYDHNRKLIFPAGNEYRRFEILDRYTPTMRVDHMEQVGDYYHATLFQDERRVNYKYDQDQDGRYYIRNGNNEENESESDYFFTHFQLVTPKIPGGELYLSGDLTGNRFEEENRMEYNLLSHSYELVLPLKQGSYNYMYLFVRDGDTVGSAAETEGNLHQTENEYYIYVYHRGFGERYDRLVGFRKLTYKP